MLHEIFREPIKIDKDDAQGLITQAESLEHQGNYFLAGELYVKAAVMSKDDVALKHETAKAFARAAKCFEVSGLKQEAAQSYLQAANAMATPDKTHDTADLFKKAGENFGITSDFFNAGNSFRQAAMIFQKLKLSQDAAKCFERAGEFFVSGNELAWARATFWDAGKMRIQEGVGYFAYVAFKKALILCIQFDKTHDANQLRKALPLSDEERAKRINPLEILEEAAHQWFLSHQKNNSHIYDEAWVKKSTDAQMIETFHEFYLEFLKIGNLQEASKYHVMLKQRQKKRFLLEKEFPAWLGCLVLEFASEYGESYKRLALFSLALVTFFALLFYAFHALHPVGGWFDYVYFSVVTFTTLGYGDIRPFTLAGKIIAIFEVMCGFVMLGLLVTMLYRRISQL